MEAPESYLNEGFREEDEDIVVKLHWIIVLPGGEPLYRGVGSHL